MQRSTGAVKAVRSAACATGQEVFSLAIVAGEMAEEDPNCRIEFAASDLSRLALERAQTGLFNQFEVQRGLPIRQLAQHFEKDGEQWRIAEAVRRQVDVFEPQTGALGALSERVRNSFDPRRILNRGRMVRESAA